MILSKFTLTSIMGGISKLHLQNLTVYDLTPRIRMLTEPSSV